jgi:hypothetical protein
VVFGIIFGANIDPSTLLLSLNPFDISEKVVLFIEESSDNTLSSHLKCVI